MSKASVQTAKPAAAPATSTALLQRKCDCGNHTAAGGECEKCAKEKRTAQAKRASGGSNDPLEHEADRIADGVLASVTEPRIGHDFSGVRVRPVAGDGRPQRKASGTMTEFSPSHLPDGGGHPIDLPLRRFMEARFDHDFGGVRLHTDARAASSAKAANALAYTAGQDIVFGPGSYAPDTPHGLHLLAHELTHVVQQSNGPTGQQFHRRANQPEADQVVMEPETSPAELEADRFASAALTPGAVVNKPSARSTGLTRGSGWAILGGIIGAVVGGLLGALAGPVGAALGAAAGAGLGAWIGGATSNSKKDDKEGTARARIHRLLSRNAVDWVVTEAEAMQALGILQEVEKKNPEELFDIVMMMKMTNEWELLREKLPRAMRLSINYYDQAACHPDHGYIMPGDRIHLEFRVSSTTRTASAEKTDDQSKPAKPQSFEEFVSHDYDVDSTGVSIPNTGQVPIVGKTLKEAADRIAEAYTDRNVYEASVDLRPVKRGVKYAGMGQVSDPETVHGGAITKDKAALARRDKRMKFADLVPWSLVEAGPQLAIAVRLYYQEVENNLDKYEDPEALWKWAKEESQKRVDEFNKKSPIQEFLEFAAHMMARVSALPPDEQARTKETYSRYIAWLSKHDKDPKLGTYKPVVIWSDAYLNIFKEEVDKNVRKQMDAAKEEKRDEEWKKAEVKFGQVVDFAIANIYPVTPTKGFSTSEEYISETSGEAVTKGYLITANPAERIIRNKIAADFMHSVLDRMQKDPEAFNKTSVKSDFADYLKNNPEQLLALRLTSEHPIVETQEDKVDIPAWQTATEVVVGFIPFVGTGVGVYEVLSGRDLAGHPLSTTSRVILGIGILLPGIAKVAKLGRGAYVASKIAQEYSLEGAEAARVYKITMGLSEGSHGAQIFDAAFKDLKAGRAVDDPKVLQEMETVLKDLGMTDKETAKALLSSVERQADTVAKEEVQAVKAIAGPITEDTEKLLLSKPELREALAESSLAATALKKCKSPCFPEQATAEQVKRLEGLLEKVKKTGNYSEDAVREFLYNRRGELDKAIGEIEMMASTKRLREGSAAKDLDAWLAYRNSNGAITQGVDPALIQAQKNLAHDVGVEAGRAMAGQEGLTISKFESPFRMGSHGQGIDDIAIKGANWDKDLIYIIEHKGGSAKLSPGQMDLDWVVGNIQRLYREGGPEGRMWAQRLAKALEDGRLGGKVYSTTVVNKAAAATTIEDRGLYKAMKVMLAP